MCSSPLSRRGDEPAPPTCPSPQPFHISSSPKPSLSPASTPNIPYLTPLSVPTMAPKPAHCVLTAQLLVADPNARAHPRPSYCCCAASSLPAPFETPVAFASCPSRQLGPQARRSHTRRRHTRAPGPGLELPYNLLSRWRAVACSAGFRRIRRTRGDVKRHKVWHRRLRAFQPRTAAIIRRKPCGRIHYSCFQTSLVFLHFRRSYVLFLVTLNSCPRFWCPTIAVESFLNLMLFHIQQLDCPSHQRSPLRG